MRRDGCHSGSRLKTDFGLTEVWLSAYLGPAEDWLFRAARLQHLNADMGSLIPCRRLRIAPRWILGIGRISSRCDWPVASLATMARMRRNTAPNASPCDTAITPQTDTTRQPSQSSRYLAAMRPAEHTACGYCHREASSPRYSPSVRPDNHTTDRYRTPATPPPQ